VSLAARLDKTLTVQRRTDVKNSIGISVPSWSDRLSSIPCSIAPASASTRAEFSRPDIVVDSEIYTATDIAVTKQDRILLESDYYTVLGYKVFANARFSSTVVYVTAVTKRNQ